MRQELILDWENYRTRTTTLGLLIAMSCVILALSSLLYPAKADLSLVWSDEFDGTELNTDNWTPDVGDGCPDLCGWGNEELEYYRPENVTVENGNLVLTAKEEFFGGRYFTSGKVHTRDKQSFLYGRIEARAKIPTGGGMWPAFWMMPQDDAYGGWAASGEIDIMESANETTWINGTIHFGGSWPNNQWSGGTYAPAGVNFSDDFHVYAIEWEPEEIRWYVDDVHYSTKYFWQWWSEGDPDNPLAPFDQDFYIILNAAVGGTYTGCTYPSCISADLPQEFLIDYVRVYQDTPNSAPMVVITSPHEGENPSPGDITIEVDAEDADGSITTVEFYNDTTYLGEDTSEPYSFTWASVPDGCHSITAKAIDDGGAFGIDTVDLTVGTGCGQEPFYGTSFTLPTRIEGEDFDIGGEGVAYHDTDPGNNGNAYRLDEDVDVQTCTDEGGGYNLGWIIEGEWLEYTVDVPVSGMYPIEIRVASLNQGGVFHLEINGFDVTGDIVAPVTGGWQTWTTVTASATLEAGPAILKFVPTDEGFNMNWIEFLEPEPVDSPELPSAGYRLHPCYPNPFNPSTTISYELPGAGAVDLKIYDVAGRLVKSLMDREHIKAGRHEVTWNGRDESGRSVSTGIYLYTLNAEGFSKTRRLALVK